MIDDLQFISFLTEFQSYMEDRRVIITGLCNGIPFTVETFPSLVGFEPETATLRGPVPNLPCKITASHKTLPYQIKKKLFKERKLLFELKRTDGRTDMETYKHKMDAVNILRGFTDCLTFPCSKIYKATFYHYAAQIHVYLKRAHQVLDNTNIV